MQRAGIWRGNLAADSGSEAGKRGPSSVGAGARATFGVDLHSACILEVFAKNYSLRGTDPAGHAGDVRILHGETDVR